MCHGNSYFERVIENTPNTYDLYINFHNFSHTMYKYVLNSVVKISVMFAKYFECYTVVMDGAFFVDMLYIWGGHWRD